MPYTQEQLISIAQPYWRNDRDYENTGKRSPEQQRLDERWAEELKRADWWHAFSARLRERFPDRSVGENPATCDTSWKYLVYGSLDDTLPGERFVVAGCVSLLAPVYAIYAVQYNNKRRKHADNVRSSYRLHLLPLPPEMDAVGTVMAREIEAYFGAEMLPCEVLEVPVPLIANFQEPPHTNLLHVLFTHEPCALP